MKIKVCEQREKRVQLGEKERWNKERRATKNISRNNETWKEKIKEMGLRSKKKTEGKSRDRKEKGKKKK